MVVLQLIAKYLGYLKEVRKMKKIKLTKEFENPKPMQSETEKLSWEQYSPDWIEL